MENEKRYKKIVQLYQTAYPDLKPQTQYQNAQKNGTKLSIHLMIIIN